MVQLSDCEALDARDRLAHLRDQFALPPGIIYLDGNSLGVLPHATRVRIADVVESEWGEGLIGSWNAADWIGAPRRIGDKIARLIGARAGEVVAADSTSINLYKVLAAALSISTRRVIVSERGNFPTDLYIAASLADELRLDGIDAIDARTAVVALTHVDYRTGRMHDMRAVTAKAHAAGALVVWDLAHSAGAVPVDLHAADADFAVGCGYKYLNGGPGAPAFLWVHPRHLERFNQPLTGWMGHAAPFEFTPEYRPAPGIERALCGTPSILALAALECGVESVLAAAPAGGIAALHTKSIALSELFIRLVETHCAQLELVSPRAPESRGSQVSVSHPEGGYAIMQALIARGVIGDFRAGEPDIMRFGFTPLYTRFVDVWHAVRHLREVLDSGEWRAPRFATRGKVT